MSTTRHPASRLMCANCHAMPAVKGIYCAGCHKWADTILDGHDASRSVQLARLVTAYGSLRDAMATLINAQCEARDDAESVNLREARSFLSLAQGGLSAALVARGWQP